MVHAATLLAIVLIAAPLASSVPLAVLAGVLLFVAWNMGDWHEFARLASFSMEQRVKLVAAFLLTVMVDLTVAMEVGMAAACIVFVYRMSTLFRVEREPSAALSDVAVVSLYGPLFFAAVAKLETLADELPPGTTALVLDAHQLVSIDASGLAAFENMHRSLVRKDVRLIVAGLNPQPLEALQRWGLEAVIGTALLVPDRAAAFAVLAAERK
jgi:SulP family sulfate permease